MRRYRFDSNKERPLNVVILARISNIYADLRYEFFLNPWELYASDSLSLNGDCIFEACFHRQSLGRTILQNHDYLAISKLARATIANA